MDLLKSLLASASGMRAQSARMRVISENLANADSLARLPGEDPYRRKLVSFKNQLDRDQGVEKVSVEKVSFDRSEFRKKFDPGHPAADANGYVKLPNVNALIEMMDMREAQRSYEANLGMIEATKSMLLKTIDILRV